MLRLRRAVCGGPRELFSGNSAAQHPSPTLGGSHSICTSSLIAREPETLRPNASISPARCAGCRGGGVGSLSTISFNRVRNAPGNSQALSHATACVVIAHTVKVTPATRFRQHRTEPHEGVPRFGQKRSATALQPTRSLAPLPGARRALLTGRPFSIYSGVRVRGSSQRRAGQPRALRSGANLSGAVPHKR
jgi:hypothetical protein